MLMCILQVNIAWLNHIILLCAKYKFTAFRKYRVRQLQKSKVMTTMHAATDQVQVLSLKIEIPIGYTEGS